MPTTSRRFFSVADPNLSPIGHEVRVFDYRDLKTQVATIDEFSELAYTIELNGPGAGSITTDDDSPFWDSVLENGKPARSILNHEYLFRVYSEGKLRAAFLGRNVETLLASEDGTRTTTISGPGAGDILTWAVIMRPGFPKAVPKVKTNVSITKVPDYRMRYRATSGSNSVPALNWQFPRGWPMMRIWRNVFRAAVQRGTLPYVKCNFSYLSDSDGEPFLFVPTIDQTATKEGFQPPNPDMNLLDFLSECTGQDSSTWLAQRLEWVMQPSFRLDVRRRIGVDRSKYVIFDEPQLHNLSRSRTRQDIRNYIVAVDDEGNESLSTSASSIGDWNKREQRNETNKNVTEARMRAKLSDIYLQQTKNEKSEWVLKVPYHDIAARQVFKNYQIGDVIGVNRYRGPSTASVVEKFRVMAISISENSELSSPEVELTLESKMESAAKRLDQKLTKLLNAPTKWNLGQLRDVDLPSKPGGGKWSAEDLVKYGSRNLEFGAGGGVKVWIQPEDPGNAAKPGDLWVRT